MILRLPNLLSRQLMLVSAVLAALWLSFFAIRSAVASHYANGETAKRLESAVQLEPSNPAYWYMLGRYQQYNLEQSDAVLAEESYKKAIALNPVATNAWLDLATAYELDGRIDDAGKTYLEAKKSYPASGEVSWRYGNFLLRQGKQGQAYAELRRAIEVDPDRAAVAFSRAYRSNPNIDELLGELLPANQRVYMGAIIEALAANQLAAATTVWEHLLSLHPRLTIPDVDRLVSALLLAGEFSEARRVWDQGVATMNLPPLLEPQSSVVWDPSFESEVNGASFSWAFPPIAQGVSIALDKTEKHSGSRSLKLSFDGKHNPNVEVACTLAVVEPLTRYRFSGWVKTKDITTEHGVGFRIHGYAKSEVPAVNTSQIYGNHPFVDIEENWTAGPGVERVRICVTREPSDDPSVRISGTAWVDDVNLVPESRENFKP
jgi:Tfp pilus assembly protein PilF